MLISAQVHTCPYVNCNCEVIQVNLCDYDVMQTCNYDVIKANVYKYDVIQAHVCTT